MKLSTITQEDVNRLLPPRNPETHKGDYGKILLLCGSRGYTGAAALAAMGALRTGAGLVYLGVPESIYAIEATKLTEPVIYPLPDKNGKLSCDSLREVLQLIEGKDAILIGPGLGQSQGTQTITEAVLQYASCPVVLDADGINVMNAHKDILRGRTSPTILTPHLGEFQRFAFPVNGNPTEAAIKLSLDLGVIVLLKGNRSVITDGKIVYINSTGNPGMATGGSGDILAGVITSLLGQGIQPLEAAAYGAWLHGAAGDLCASEIGMYGMLPTDMLNALPRLLK